MSATRKVRIHAAPTSANSWVEVDGEQLTNVRAVSVRSGVGEPTTVMVEFVNVDVEIDGVADVTAIGDKDKRYQRGDA